jgi:hypothetical protein
MRMISTDSASREEVRAILRRSLTLEDAEIESRVRAILNEVAARGDNALREYTARFDGVQLTHLEVTSEELRRAQEEVSPPVAEALQLAAERIRRFHEHQKRTSWFEADERGGLVGQMVTPLRRVGVYVPGGLAVYPSSVLMCAIPAQVAGVEEIILCTPPRKDGTVHPLVLMAAQQSGVSRIFKVGGAQAVAAMAYGTQSIPAVDKIVGPGNIYVTVAKKLVYGMVGIDMLAGPSEVCILADDTADPRYVAIDMLTQAEHDIHTAAFLITPSRSLAQAVQEEIEKTVAGPTPAGYSATDPRAKRGYHPDARYGGSGRARESVRSRAPGADGRRAVALPASHSLCRRGDDGRIFAPVAGRLRRRSQPHPAHQRYCPLRIAAERGRFCEEDERGILHPRSPAAGGRRYRDSGGVGRLGSAPPRRETEAARLTSGEDTR